MCESELLFNLQGIRKHVRRAHNMSMDEYKVTYSPFTGGKGIRKGRPSKKKTLKEMKLKKKRKVEEGERYMFHAMDDNELENKAGVHIFLTNHPFLLLENNSPLAPLQLLGL